MAKPVRSGRAKGKGYWWRQIEDAYRAGREDGAAKQEHNYERGFHLGKEMGQKEGYAEGYKKATLDDAGYWWMAIGRFRSGRKSTWERICNGQMD